MCPLTDSIGIASKKICNVVGPTNIYNLVDINYLVVYKVMYKVYYRSD